MEHIPGWWRAGVGILLSAVTVVSAAPTPDLDATALMAQAAKTVDLRARDGAPFRLLASFWVEEPGVGKLDGRYEMLWRSPHAWREEIAYPGHNQLTGQDDHGAWTLTELTRRSLRMFDVATALDVTGFVTLPSGARVEKVKVTTGKAPVARVELALPGRFPSSELSLDRNSGLLVRHALVPPMTARLAYKATHEFSEYRPWHGRQFPTLIKRFDGKRQVLELRVESLADLPEQSSARLGRPDEATAAPVCTEEERGAKVTCDVSLKPGVTIGPNDKGGSVAARAVVGRDGRLHDIVLVEKANSFDLEGRFLEYLELWRCVPLTCGGTPVDAEVFETMTTN